jgi:N-acetylmuramoyl-L-alanine amidase
MRFRLSLLFTLAAGVFLMVSATASAYFVHVVTRGESLSSIAAADGVSVQQLAAANGLSPNAQLVIGSTVQIPPQGSTATASPAPVVTATGTAAGDGDNDGDDVGSSASSVAASAGSVAETAVSSGGAAGSYVVQPGDTLSAIAARAGLSVAQLAAANGLDPNGVLVSGTGLSVPGAGSGSAASSTATAVPVSTTVTTTSSTTTSGQVGPPYPTPVTLDAGTVGSIGAANGAPSSLTQAVGWQESGFNNDLVSGTGAVGVMQIEPGTWNYINQVLTPGAPLDPYSATDNVRAGSLLLHSLLSQTGGDASLAAAGYYQGLASVQQNGMYPDTQQYVQSVLALQSQYGGG